MNQKTADKAGGISLIIGSLLLTVYSAAFSFLLPVKTISSDLSSVVRDPNWRWIAAVAFLGVVLMMIGFATVYSRLRSSSGLTGLLGILFIEAAYLLQACKVTWEIFLYPVIASNPGSSFLLRDGIIKHDAMVVAFRTGASITIFLGIVLFCLALVRSREFPKIAAVLIFAGAFVYALGPLLSIIVAIAGIFTHSIGCLILGLKLARE